MNVAESSAAALGGCRGHPCLPRPGYSEEPTRRKLRMRNALATSEVLLNALVRPPRLNLYQSRRLDY